MQKGTGMAGADAHVLSETHILLFLVQFFLLLCSARLLGIVFEKWKQPTVTADILVGILFGPSILGRLLPGLHRVLFPADPLQYGMLDTVAWIGILFLLLVTGLEVNFSSVWRQKGKALWISLSDIIIPIVLSAVVLYFLPDRYMLVPERRLLFTLFLSTIMTISAMPVSIRIMRDLGILRTDMGFLTISALSINDVIGWVVFTIMLGIFTHGQPDVLFVLRLVVLTVAFTALVFTVGRSLLDRLITVIRRRARDYTGYSLAVVALTGLGFGAITQSIGIHALFGFFLAGLAAGEAQNLTENTRNSISQMVYAVFVPVFFANIGLKVDVIGNFDIFLVVLLTALGIAVRFIGAWAGGMFAGIARGDRGTVAALHTPGGEMHIVIGALALELRLIDEVVFVAIVVAAILSSVTLGPWVSWLLKRISRALLLQIPRGSALDLAAMDKYDALEELCAAAAGEIQLNVQELYTAVEARERGMSTAIGDGLALPHARLEKIRKPTIIFGRSCAGIDWNAPDGAPTRLTFLILTPDDEKDSQLQIYRDLLSVLSKPQLRSSLCGAESPETAREALNDALLQHSKDAAGGI